ncbi:MAG TPA: aldehyde dehydrogenase family protein [Chitinophagales bacterium]|nr:aldehyde dehydrogenase family protein [Chitinophagales bacterium]
MIATVEKTKTNRDFLKKLNIHELTSGACTGTQWLETLGQEIESYSPVDGELIGKVKAASRNDYEKIISIAQKAFLDWRKIPSPKRGEVVRQIGDELRKYKESLGMLVSYEMGKSYQEGLGEVQEMIDICDFAVGLSRQLYGLTMHSERPNHRMYEQWHPLGIVGVITAFNFPVAVWAWNAMLALVCGDVVVWKPSSKVMLCAVATHQIIQTVLEKNTVPEGVCCLVAGSSKEIGDVMLEDKRIPLISATGSTRVGIRVAQKVGERLGRSILELGGNNAIIISENANLDLAIRAVTFGAVGTCGQRCTSTRRLVIHESVYDKVKERLTKIYSQLSIGNPLDPNNHVGPLIDEGAVKDFQSAIEKVKDQGGKILIGGDVLNGEGYETGCYVAPCIAEVTENLPIVKHETFAPLLYLMKYKTMDEAIHLHNDVPQGLSSAIFTDNMKEMEAFLSVNGSDCGIANVNIGTSGAEIGGAFGGEKETGGGRESGSDSWKQYMRRQTNTINYGDSLPLAQGIKFTV